MGRTYPEGGDIRRAIEAKIMIKLEKPVALTDEQKTDEVEVEIQKEMIKTFVKKTLTLKSNNQKFFL